MDIKKIDIFKIGATFGVIVVALSISFYFVWLLPKENKKKNDIEIELKQYELNSKKITYIENQKEDAIAVRDLCISEASSFYSEFALIHIHGATKAAYDLSAFEDNASIYIALDGYSRCLENNPKYSTNDNIKELKKQSSLVMANLRTGLAYYKDKEKLNCNEEKLYSRTQKICLGLDYKKDMDEYASLAVNSGEFGSLADAIKSKEEKLSSWSGVSVK